LEGASKMGDYEKTSRLLKAFVDVGRLQILECIQRGISNPGEISRELNRHRSTVEKHLRVLLKAGIVEKVPSLTKSGQLSIRYRIRENANQFFTTITDAANKF
jgi:DNA-binding transcriptional ArsR family regulator